jgi:hypothetical protein
LRRSRKESAQTYDYYPQNANTHVHHGDRGRDVLPDHRWLRSPDWLVHWHLLRIEYWHLLRLTGPHLRWLVDILHTTTVTRIDMGAK